MQFDRGYLSSYFATNREKLLVEMSNAHLLITDKKIVSAQEILPILQHIATTNATLLIIAEDIEGDALSTLVVNQLKGTLKVAAVKAPAFGDRRKAMLEDLAILTNATFVTEEKGFILRDVGADVLGKAAQIFIDKDKTTIVGGAGKRKAIQDRIQTIDAEINIATSNYDKEKLQERKAKLQGSVAVISVGALTESEMKKKKQMFEDSLHSTRAALEEGIVPGGGVSLLKTGRAIETKALSKEEQVGAQILINACKAPFKQLIQNAGHEPSVLLEEVLSAEGNFGFNVLSEKVEDLLKAGVIDSAKVIKTSLSHAVSMAGIVLLSEALIANGEE